MTLVKVCGVTQADDAARVAAGGADFIGLNFWPKSKRYIAPDRAPMIAGVARGAGAVKIVGVFVDASLEEIQEITTRVDLDIIQLHGDEDPDTVQKVSTTLYRPVWKALPIASGRDIERLGKWPADALLLDAPTPGRGGAGATFDWNLAHEVHQRYPGIKLVLAGGLRPDNVMKAIQTVAPWAVDVASGVEAAPGIKDAAKLDAFIAAVRMSKIL